MNNRREYIPIFVGSTYSDLIEHRKAVMESLHKLKTIVNGMEYFGAKPGSPIEECLNSVRESRIYIGIFAMRYGSIEDKYEKSFTHLEYLEAQKLKLPSLIYLIDEERQPLLAKQIDTGENAIKLVNLKDELKKKFIVSFFTTPEDLASKISQDLPPILQSIGVVIHEDKINLANLEEQTKMFEKRPRKYAGSEIILSGELQDDATKGDVNEAEAFGLRTGDTLENRLKTSFAYFRVYADDKMADELEKYTKGDKVTLKLKFLFGEERDVEWTEEGNIVKQRIVTGYEILDIKPGANEPAADNAGSRGTETG